MTPRHSTIALAFAAALLLIAGSGQPAAARDGPSPALRASSPHPVRPAGAGTVMYFPAIFHNALPQAIIVDHTSTDLSRIPAYWIEQAKGFVVHYAHTSHGSQVLSGLQWLEGENATYSVQVTVSGGVANPATPGALSFYDGNNYPPSNTYITPDMFWEVLDGVTHTRSVAATGWFDFSTWTWCGQASYYSTTQIQLYLDTLDDLEQEYPGMRFIYMTGHTDGTGPTGPLYQNNNQVRQYARENGKILLPEYNGRVPVVRELLHRPPQLLRQLRLDGRLRPHAPTAVQDESAGVVVADGAPSRVERNLLSLFGVAHAARDHALLLARRRTLCALRAGVTAHARRGANAPTSPLRQLMRRPLLARLAPSSRGNLPSGRHEGGRPAVAATPRRPSPISASQPRRASSPTIPLHSLDRRQIIVIP
jgi:hypothetical protein